MSCCVGAVRLQKEEVIKSLDVDLTSKYCDLLLFTTCPGTISNYVTNDFIH